MEPFLPYIACILLAFTMFIALNKKSASSTVFGIVASVALAGWLLGMVTGSIASFGEWSQGLFFYIFSLAAIGAAIRMITHSRPVYCALHFVLVVIATSGLFLILEAEFMTFALIIVYAGAILITYMFVLMLANQASNPEDEQSQAAYDRIPKDPLAAVGVGFFMLCLVTGTVIGGGNKLPPQIHPHAQWAVLESMPKQFEATVLKLDESFAWPPEGGIQSNGEEAFVISSEGQRLVLPEEALPKNTQMVGWSLVADFPVNLELAGVILLMAMFGAAVLARRAIELGEREKRAAILGETIEEEQD